MLGLRKGDESPEWKILDTVDFAERQRHGFDNHPGSRGRNSWHLCEAAVHMEWHFGKHRRLHIASIAGKPEAVVFALRDDRSISKSAA